MDVLAADTSDESLLLDLLNTTPVVDGVATDVLGGPPSAGQWLADHGLNDNDREALRDVRAALQAVVRGDENALALRHFVGHARLQPTVTEAGIDWLWESGGPIGPALRVVLAWDALRLTSPGRLRPCANTECHLFLLDRSKPNNARWCSMAVCGNRMKARRHYQRNRLDHEI